MAGNEATSKVSKSRAVGSVLALLTAVIALVVGFVLSPQGEAGHQVIATYAQAPWLAVSLLSIGFGSILICLGFADPSAPTATVFEIWLVLLVSASLNWFVPLMFAIGRYSWDRSESISFLLLTFPALSYISLRRKKTASSEQAGV